MDNFVRIKDFKIGKKHPCFIIAEAGVNHNGNINIAHKLIESAKAAGADAVKFQCFKAESLVTRNSGKADYQLKTTSGDDSQFSMLKQLELSDREQAQLKKHCDDEGILYLCTPYEQNSADLLETIGVDAYKIASTDTSNIPFLRYLAPKNIPVILSTGMSNLGDVEESVDELKKNGLDGKIIILQCTAEYPAPLEDINLRAMKTMELAFGCPVGFSDHTSGIGASPWAVAAGACVVEKHFTLDRCMEGPDHKASIEPQEMGQMVSTIRNVELALGDGMKRIMPSERKNKSKMQKSLVATREISAGRMIKPEDLTCKRPGTGLPPNWLDKVIGQQVLKTIKKDDVLTLEAIAWKSE